MRDLGIQFQVSSLIKQCEEIIDHFKTNKKLFDSGKKVEISTKSYQGLQSGIIPGEVPVVMCNLKKFLATNEYSDVNIYVKGQGLVARAHKLVLSLWSAPFAKVCFFFLVTSDEFYLCYFNKLVN